MIKSARLAEALGAARRWQNGFQSGQGSAKLENKSKL
jgi:hypothetical protein